MSYLELVDVTFYYQKDKLVLDGLSMSVSRSELFALLGESGSGKTTVLKVIAGFLRPQKGRVVIDGVDYTDVPPNRRGIGIVFQSYALFPHMTVLENITYGLRVRGVSKDEAVRKARELMKLLEIEGLENRRPSELSGGQQQRVALARALVIEPRILLLDEPMSNIDPKLRSKLRKELKRIQRELGVTAIYVTHDQEDAFEIGDRIGILYRGRMVRVDTPRNLLVNPESAYVASFIGYENIVPLDALANANTGWEDLLNEMRARGYKEAGIRASSVRILPALSWHPQGADDLALRGTVLLRTFKKEGVSYLVETAIGRIEALSNEDHFKQGDAVVLVIDKRSLAFLR